MKVKSKKIVAAVALALAAAVTGTASASPISNDDLFFSAWDTANNNSIIVNLNLSVDQIRANPSSAYTLIGNGATGLQNWLSTANLGAVQWTVMGVKNDGTGADIPPSNLYGGVSTSIDIETIEKSWGSYGGLDTTVTTTPTFLATVNPFLGSNDYYVGSGISALKFASQDGGVAFEGRSSVGSSMNFYSFFASQAGDANNDGLPDSFFEGDFTKLAGQWSLAVNGGLAYTVAAGPGPVTPIPAAVWLLGSGLAGLVSIGRRKSAAVAA